jgi:hypothetical protein
VQKPFDRRLEGNVHDPVAQPACRDRRPDGAFERAAADDRHGTWERLQRRGLDEEQRVLLRVQAGEEADDRPALAQRHEPRVGFGASARRHAVLHDAQHAARPREPVARRGRLPTRARHQRAGPRHERLLRRPVQRTAATEPGEEGEAVRGVDDAPTAREHRAGQRARLRGVRVHDVEAPRPVESPQRGRGPDAAGARRRCHRQRMHDRAHRLKPRALGGARCQRGPAGDLDLPSTCRERLGDVEDVLGHAAVGGLQYVQDAAAHPREGYSDCQYAPECDRGATASRWW